MKYANVYCAHTKNAKIYNKNTIIEPIIHPLATESYEEHR